MDENETETHVIKVSSYKHNGWSVLIPTLGLLSRVVGEVAGYVDSMVEIAIEHANYLTDEEKLREIERKWTT